MIRLVLLSSLLFFSSIIYGQQILDQYVQEAIRNNLSIKEKKLLEQKEAFGAKRAGKEGGPEVQFLSSYTLADGGRTIQLPIGDLLNDVYSTLNDLTGTQNFPQVSNQEVELLPNNFYDVRFRITQPILQPEIKYNKLIQQEEVNMAGLMTDQTIRDLVRDVKTAYLTWMRAHDAIDIIDQGALLLKEPIKPFFDGVGGDIARLVIGCEGKRRGAKHVSWELVEQKNCGQCGLGAAQRIGR